MKRTFFSGLAALALSAALFGAAEAAEKMRISLDTNPTHVRNKGIELFVERLKEKVGDELEIEVYPSAQLYRDRDVARALRQGSVEMAVPGTWVLDGMEPSLALTSLPMFYGIDEAATLELMDGEIGQEINERTEDRLRVKVLGPWMNLGFSHFYSTNTPLRSHDDLKGLKIRISGGTANAKRAEGLGGIPNVIAWPDVPLALSSSVVDAVSSTHESIASAKLWDAGLKYALEDRQWFGQYVPMISAQFWEKLSPEVQDAILETWNETIPEARSMAADAQSAARQTLIDNGIEITTASDEELAEARKTLMGLQDGLVQEMKIDPELVDMARQEMQERGLAN
jgi:TRAP-type C4-dicarboxylate transport system substrate-binding protein